MLTTAQLTILKAAIDADPALNNLPLSDDDAFFIASAMNAQATPDYFVWRPDTPVQSVFDAINWANMTPVDAPDGTALWTNRSLACQGKQFNLQTMLSGRDTISSNKPSIRAGLQDALTGLPSGAGGAARSGGWSNVQLAMQRLATRVEKLLIVSGTGSTASPALMGFEGPLTYGDVQAARVL
jgi:hypothetical protein